MHNFNEILDKKGLRISHQRIKILQYLSADPCHPTADKILNEMKKDMPTLSKSTVYKTLNAFVDANILKEITIEDNQIRYEYNLIDHGHFKCTKCGDIYDFEIDIDSIKYKDLAGCRIIDKNVYFKGICYSCLKDM